MKNVVVFDIDGTIAEMGERKKLLLENPIDWEKFYEDAFDDNPIVEILELISGMYTIGYNIVFCTSRKEKSRKKTEEWLIKFAPCFYYDLLMRADDDNRPDDITKPEMLEKAGYTTENVLFIVEDRARVVKKWRELGFTCLQCAEGDF